MKKRKGLTIYLRSEYLYIFSVILGVVIGIFIVNAFGTNNPSNFGHSVGEMDWSQPIPGNLLVSGEVSVNGQGALRSDANAITVGDLVNNDGARELRLRANDQDQVIVSQSGDVGIGTMIPTAKLDVNGKIRMPSTNFYIITIGCGGVNCPVTANCNSGDVVTGGGFRGGSTTTSAPTPGNDGWMCQLTNSMTCFAVCFDID